ncbi:MAG TPA: hypothetical protein DGG95_01790 [Cytophagales bacterium]|jgi:hypothetical protein|nr:hypothetical protein [Cytophagales bacterium]
MKKLMLLLLALVTVNVWAQNFEGTIKWSMKMDVTDPEMKAKMEAGQQKMNDPVNQARMKEMQEKMNDPKMKAMMEANPQMKAMMQKMTQGAANGDMMSAMIPKGMIVKIKGGNSLVTMDGGMMSGDFLHTSDKSVKLDRDNKTYWVMPAGKGGPGGMDQNAKPTVTKTSETMKVLGYTCTKYVATTTERGQTITTNIWTTTEIKDIDTKSFAKQRMGRGQSIFYEGIDGVPLRIESSTKEGNMVMEVTDIKRESLDASLFTIPSDYKETQGGFGGFGGMR